MKKIFIPLAILFLLFAGYVSYRIVNASEETVTSPLPKSLTSSDNKQVTTLEIWKPILSWLGNNQEIPPELTARSVLMYSLANDKAIYEKAPEEKIPMASLTKVMTAIIALENPKPDDRYRVFKENLVGESTMGLSEGEVLSLKELLYGLILHSGNDASETLASNFPGGRLAFIKAMNDKAKALGLSDTNFTNPSGLEGDGNQYSTASDLLVMTRYALYNFPTFSQIVAAPEYHIEASSSHGEYFLTNETNLLTTYPGVKGVKTGYTTEAGFCLITYLDYKNEKIIGILLGSQNRRQEMKDLLDYSLRSLGVEPPEHI